MRYLLVFLFPILILASCSKPKEKSKGSKMRIEQDSIKVVADKLGVQVWFPERYITTYEYQHYLKVNNKLLLPRFTIVDIVDYDSIILLTIEADCYPAVFIEMVCTEAQISDVLDLKGKDRYEIKFNLHYSAVVEITSIRKVKYAIESSIEDDSYESEDGETYIPSQYVSLSLDVSDSFICKGKLIQLYPTPEF